MRPSVRSITASGFALLICGALHAEEPCLSGIVLTTDRTIDCTSHQTIAKAVWHDGMNEQQKAYAMWRFFISRNMHKEIASPCIEDPGNASELLIKSAYSLCGDWATRWANCMADNGMQGGRVFMSNRMELWPIPSRWIHSKTATANSCWLIAVPSSPTPGILARIP